MSDPFVAEVRLAGFNFAPRGWAFCNGTLIPIVQNTALFSLLGTTYGGDGKTTFALPNLQGRSPIGPGQGPGLPLYDLGQQGGSATVTLSMAHLPAHSHGIAATSAAADRANPAAPNVLATPPDPTYTSQPQTALGHPTTIGAAGGGQPHNNLQPYLVLNFIIALQGVFPPRG